MAAANWSQEQVFNQLNGGERWSGNTITYAFPTSASGMFSQGEAAGFRAVNSTQQGLMTLALATWDELITQGFAQGTPGATNIEFGYTSTEIGYAHAYYPDIGSVWFNVTESSLVSTAVGEYGFQTFIHEIGHALGLDHMGDYNGNGNWSPSSFQDSVVLSIMSYFGPRYAAPNYSADVMQADWVAADGNTYSPQTPMLNDIMAIQRIYGASTTTRLDNTVYGFSSTVGGTTGRIYDFTVNVNPILTIFDSGGNDTLDLSGWSTSSRVDLRGGAFSSANSMTNNIAIAYDTVVENARTGSGNDVLGGNSAANRLEGGAGNDEINGLEGDDTLIGAEGNDTIDGGGGTDTVVFSGTFASYSISVAGTVITISGGASGTDRISNVERFQFADVLRTLSELAPTSDTVAPALQSLLPADNGSNVSPGANLVLSFNEAVKTGSGTISIFYADGTLFRSISADDSTQVRINGNSATIDPGVNFDPSRSYYVVVGAGVFTDLAGNAWGGLSGTTAWNFTTGAVDSSAPQVVALTPGDDSGDVSRTSNLTIVFNEAVVAGSGNIVIRSGSTVVATIAATNAAQVSIEGSTVTINPSADLSANTSYSVTIEAGAFRDAAGNSFTGITSSTGWNFRTAAGTATDDFPYHTDTTGAVNINGAAATGTIEVPDDGDLFKVSLVAGTTYTFTLERVAGGLTDPYLYLFSPLPNLDFLLEDDDSAGASNARITYTPTQSGMYYLGVWDYSVGTGGYTLRATTEDIGGPALLSVTPADNATLVSTATNLVLTFSESVQRGSGFVRILTTNGNVVREIDVANTSAVTINGSTVTIDPGSNLPGGAGFYINIDAGAFEDNTGNEFEGLTGSTEWNFSTAVPTTTDDYPLNVSTSGQIIPNGSTVTARIDSANDGDLFKVQLTAGTTYRFDMVSPFGSEVDPYLVLYGMLPDVELIAYDDDSGQGLDSLLYFTPTTTGIYYLAAFDYSESTGNYRLSATTESSDIPGSVATSRTLTANGASASSRIDMPTDSDMFAISLAAGTQYTFDLRSTGLEDPYLRLFDGGGNVLAQDDDTGVDLNSQITYTPATGGTYYVAASDFDTGTGPYSLAAIVRNVINGGAAAEAVTGGTGADTLYAGGGNDTLRGQQGDDILDGGSGIDMALYNGPAGNFEIQALATGWAITDTVGNQGRDLLYGVERVQWDNIYWALDLDGHAGTTVRTLGAVFGAGSVENYAYVGIGLDLLDGGMNEEALMQLALDAALGSNASHTAVVNLLYSNLVGTLPSPADLAFYKGLLDGGVYSPAELGILAAESDWNLANIGWEDLLDYGVGYL